VRTVIRVGRHRRAGKDHVAVAVAGKGWWREITTGQEPPPQTPQERAIEVTALAPDADESGNDA
jgi:hypothetical protein